MERNLSTLPRLKNSGFGQPSPRHGLNLLYWFANRCVRFSNNRLMMRCRPSKGDFGFQPFYNYDGLLPVTNLHYYEVGNIHEDRDNSLPSYVTENYTSLIDNSNTDRIIVGLNSGRIKSLYVTCHKDQLSFDSKQTYRITVKLIKTIKRMSREDFLKKVTNSEYMTPTYHFDEQSSLPSYHQYHRPSRKVENKWCKIFCATLLIIVLYLFISFIG